MKQKKPYAPAEISVCGIRSADLLAASAETLQSADQGEDIVISW